MDRDFSAFFTSTLKPVLDVLESRRVRTVRNTWIAAGISAAVTIPTGLAAGWFALIPGVAGLVTVAVIFGMGSSAIRRSFKHDVLTKVAAFAGEGFSYSPEGFVRQDVFESSGLAHRTIDRYRGEDLISGKLDKTAFMCSEINAEHREVTHDSKGRRQESWTTVFKGLYFVGDFNKDFSARTMVLPDVAEKFFGNFIGGLIQKANFTVPGKVVKLEDPEFEKAFAVYSEDEIECRYILTPALMRRLMDFRAKSASGLMVSFVGSCVHVAIPTGRNMFEPAMNKPVNTLEMMQGMLDDMLFVLGIVDDLNLNTRIWTRQ